jgi:hypothetical protein
VCHSSHRVDVYVQVFDGPRNFSGPDRAYLCARMHVLFHMRVHKCKQMNVCVRVHVNLCTSSFICMVMCTGIYTCMSDHVRFLDLFTLLTMHASVYTHASVYSRACKRVFEGMQACIGGPSHFASLYVHSVSL